MNIAVVFAGGKGTRMKGAERPKQFLEINNKPILIHTLEKFEKNPNIDAIVLATLEDWIDYVEELLKKYNIKKVLKVLSGGTTSQMSVYNCLEYSYKNFPKNSIVLIHDGVRPFITDDLINENIETVKKYGTAISSVNMTETVVEIDNDGMIEKIPERSKCILAKAPQSFYLEDIYQAHKKAQEEEFFSSIDSCNLVSRYGTICKIIYTDYDNIKITTNKDMPIAEFLYKKLNHIDN